VAFAPRALPSQAAIAILGGGIMGCALAYWLARRGQRPVLLERNPQPGAGATGRNGGLWVAGPNRAYAAAVEAHGHAAAHELLAATWEGQRLLEEVLAREGIEAGYRVTGFLALAGDDAERAALRATAEALTADGAPAEWLDRAAAERCLGTALGPKLSGALYTRGDGVIHSAAYTLGVAQAAERHGAQLLFETPVHQVRPGPGGRGWSVETPRGRLDAEQVAVTLNAWAPDLFPELARVLTPVRGHIILSAPVAARLRPWGANRGFEYGRQLETGQLLLGGLRHTRPDLDQGYAPAPGANAPPALPELVAALSQHLGVLFPALAGTPLQGHWTGVMDFSPDLNPLAGRWPGREGLWLLVGFSGHGMPYSQILPAALAGHMLGEASPAIPSALAPDRVL
jgi:glycine/D-amino acid oxidase-like deaminating enzyme